MLRIASPETAPQIWNAVLDQFEHKNAATLFILLQNLFSLVYNDTTRMSEHYASFASIWANLLERTTTAKDCVVSANGLETALNALATSPAAKGALMRCSLPKSMANIVDNLQTKADLTYQDAYERLVDLGTSKV